MSAGTMDAGQDTGRALPPAAYRNMAAVLRIGLLAALGFITGGAVAYLAQHAGEGSAAAINSNPILPLLSVGGLGAGLASGEPLAFVTVGLLILVATPLLRVASGFYYFRAGGERRMAAVTLTVLALLLLGLLVVGPLVR
jgi:uncharacterized membrane protein